MIKDATYITQAIILKSQPWREHDSQAVVFSKEQGKLKLIVRGAKKNKSKLQGHTQPFMVSELMVIKGRSGEYIGGAQNAKAYWNLRQGLNKLNLAGKAFYLFDRLVRFAEKDEQLYNLLLDLLTVLDVTEEDVDSNLATKYYLGYTWQLLSVLGYAPELYLCSHCQNNISGKNNYFQLDRATVACNDIKPNNFTISVSQESIKILRFLLENNLNKVLSLQVSSKQLQEVANVSNKFVQYHFEDYLK